MFINIVLIMSIGHMKNNFIKKNNSNYRIDISRIREFIYRISFNLKIKILNNINISHIKLKTFQLKH